MNETMRKNGVGDIEHAIDTFNKNMVFCMWKVKDIYHKLNCDKRMAAEEMEKPRVLEKVKATLDILQECKDVFEDLIFLDPEEDEPPAEECPCVGCECEDECGDEEARGCVGWQRWVADMDAATETETEDRKVTEEHPFDEALRDLLDGIETLISRARELDAIWGWASPNTEFRKRVNDRVVPRKLDSALDGLMEVFDIVEDIFFFFDDDEDDTPEECECDQCDGIEVRVRLHRNPDMASDE